MVEKPISQKESGPPLTERVGSRFYRAPELVLCQPSYDYGVDIWAIGCILGELLVNFIEDEKSIGQYDLTDNQIVNPLNMYLCPGDSCYPLSPMR